MAGSARTRLRVAWYGGGRRDVAVVRGTGPWYKPGPRRVAVRGVFVHDRVRAQELFDFDYYLEMYKPEAKRRWGYFALPVLHDDQLVGKVDAIADRKASVLRVNAIHEDVRFTRAVTKAVHAELDALAAWLGLSRLT